MPEAAEIYGKFQQSAELYCSTVEDQSVKGMDGLRLIQDCLLTVYSTAIHLPEVDAEKVEVLKSPVSHTEWREMFESLKLRLPVELRWDTFDPLGGPSEKIVPNLLADDLADVWSDLKEGLILLQSSASSKAQIDVWWEWRFGFHTHWGAHAIDALRAMYYALRDT